MIAKDIIYPDETYEYGVVDDYGDDLDEEDYSGSGEACMMTGMAASEIKEAEDAQ